LAAALLVPTATVLGLAAWLTPDPTGVGTHIQLGLEPCIMMSWLTLPCPMCGMTTTFSLMAHLRPIDAFLNQPFGVVLFGMTFATVVIALMEIVRPKKRWMAIISRMNGREQWYIAGFLLMMLTAWAYKIGLVRHFLFNPA
jgi:hypothetical protein